MPECIRCKAFTDAEKSGQYRYCLDCQQEFEQVEQNGVVVEGSNGEYTITVTADESHPLDGGKEYTQHEALARGLKISDELGVPGLFKYKDTGSIWMLDAFLQQHSSVRSKIYKRLGRAPDQSQQSNGFLSKLRSFF